ncbi:hypothetical protein EV198_2543 [Roseivirga ehrenbergii]|uniref:Lipoprotein n=1 Tax=Roseivirga ehrenbergii (strain DSM 102268 / JCM 13514 / KCTC 12282 / NCIMB 14502 / KMM 6017) TaxID=279360 RepID=A0A150XT58_ROSEK|nr:hypothetical protein [Roseivirga ehrenbergii]KYG81939.1 hypothetical protein MB14_00665 [Roseivirga ehrenbergii]TCL01755.1 hypothetical protein EV198_2543 [Roseivirga ehrenbergii]
MRKKTKVFATLLLLCFFLSSCVYSLFPIYTDDTLVYLPEIVGKWQSGSDEEDYILISDGVSVEGTVTVTESDTKTPKESGVKISKPTFSVTIDEGDYAIIEGDTVRDQAKIQAYYEKQFDSLISSKEMKNNFRKFGENLSEFGNRLNDLGKPNKPKSYTIGEKSYLMTVVDDGEPIKYELHLVKIGDDIFMDLAATDSDYSDAAFESRVWFPVHTFMKMDLNGDQLKLTQFDLDKLNKLFKSNLIRLRHENVDGTILITAQPKELQKFLDKYSDDESVFDDPETYTRVAQ